MERRIVFGKALFKMENISVAPDMSPTPLLRPRRKKGAKMNGNLVFFFMMRTQISDLSDFSAAQISDAMTTTSNLLALDSCSGKGLRTRNSIFKAFDI